MSDFRFNSGFIQPNYFLPQPNYNVPPPHFPYQNAVSGPSAALTAIPPAVPPPFYQNFSASQPFSVSAAPALVNPSTYIPNVAQPPPAFGTLPDVRLPPPAIRSFNVRQPPPFVRPVPELRPVRRPPGAFPLNCPPPSIPSPGNNTNCSKFSAVSSVANDGNINVRHGFFNNGYNSSRCMSPRPIIPGPPRLCSNQISYRDHRGGHFKNNRQYANVTNGTNQLLQGKRHYADNGMQFTNNSKRQKVDKRDLPENNKFCCEVCDRGFKTEETFRLHVDSHVKCTAEGCKFSAHPKLVKMHYESQHRTGLAKKIWSLQSKEDLEKWKEERKRNYPTAENVERKKKERSDRLARGEVMENKYFGRMRGGRDRGFRGRGRQRYNGRSGGYDREYSRSEEIQESDEVETVENLISSSIERGNDSAARKQKVNDDNNNDDDDGPPCVSSSRQDPVDLSDVPQDDNRKCTGNEGVANMQNSPQKSLSLMLTIGKGNKQQNNKRRKQKDRQLNKRMQKSSTIQEVRRRPALLERLLTNEIRHERNIVLQCVRYLASKMSESGC